MVVCYSDRGDGTVRPGIRERAMAAAKYNWEVGRSPPILDEHSRAKHRLVRDYISRYIEILTSNPRRDSLSLTLVDGFAGGGEYLYRGELAPGSPLIMLEEVEAARQKLASSRTKDFRLRAEFVFVEQKVRNCAYLRETIRRSPFGAALGRNVHVKRNSFANELDGIIDGIRAMGPSQRAIFLLDQYGYSQVGLRAIRSILARLNNPEIILTFSVDWLINYLSNEPTFLRGLVPAELGVEQVQRMLAMQEQQHARWFIQNFLYRHIIERTGARFYTPFYLISRTSNRSYWLIHMSNHFRARDEMARRHWALSTHSIHHGQPGLNMLGFVPDRDLRQLPLDYDFDQVAASRTTDALLTELPELIFAPAANGGPPPTVGGLFADVSNHTPATVELLTDAILKLREEKEIEVFAADGRSRPRTNVLVPGDIIRPAVQRSLFSAVWPPQLPGPR